MKPTQLHIWGLPLVVAVVVALTPTIAMAQVSGQALDAASAASPGLQPNHRLMTPEQKRDSATVPGDLRPERPVTPQINMSFGKIPPASPSAARPVPRSAAASATGVNDAAARCEAQDSDSLRASCRAKLARESKAAPLN
jgi:hypothetical protein